MNLLNVFAEAFEPTGKPKIILCDGDCGNCYNEEDLYRTSTGKDLCNDCMFTFIREQDCDQ